MISRIRTPLSVLWALLCSLSFLPIVLTQGDWFVYGMFDVYTNPVTVRATNAIYSRCFRGLGFTTCKPVLPDDDTALSYQLPYLSTIGDLQGAQYCLQCCGSSPDHVDRWDLRCPVDSGTRNQMNVYGYELRMARRRSNTDTAVVRCPLRRSACVYNALGETLSCDRTNDRTYLVGYTLRLRVVSRDENFLFWRGVEACEIESVESTTPLSPGESFAETIVLDHEPLPYPNYDYSKIGSVSLCFLFVAYLLLYFCRRKHCPYCQKKLVLAANLCFTCQFYGVKPPDPVLLRALESKGEISQGSLPERFPGARACMSSLHVLCFWTTCFQPRTVKVHPVLVYKSQLELVGKEQAATAISAEDEEIAQLENALAKEDEEERKDTEREGESDDELRQRQRQRQRQRRRSSSPSVAVSPPPSSPSVLSVFSRGKKSKYERLRAKWEKQRERAKKKNENVLDVPPEIIFQAVDHPHFLEFKPQSTPPASPIKRSIP